MKADESRPAGITLSPRVLAGNGYGCSSNHVPSVTGLACWEGGFPGYRAGFLIPPLRGRESHVNRWPAISRCRRIDGLPLSRRGGNPQLAQALPGLQGFGRTRVALDEVAQFADTVVLLAEFDQGESLFQLG